MAECTIIGDSIATGLGQVLGTRCEVHARVGAGATEIARWALAGSGSLLIVAIGSNGPTPAALQGTLPVIAAGADRTGRRIVWILPTREPNRGIVAQFAGSRGEAALSFQPGRDGIHPAAYGPLAARAVGGG